MSLQILRDGTNVGGRLGEALGSGLQALAQHKLGQLQQRQQQARNTMGLQALGLGPQQAQNLSQLDPQALQEIIKSQLQGQREKEFQQQWMGQQPQPGQEGVAGQQQVSPQQQLGTEGFPAPRNSREAMELAKAAQQERHFKAKQEQEAKKIAKQEEESIAKETQPYYESLRKEDRAAKENDKRLKRIKELATKGNLGSPITNTAIKTLAHGVFGIGLDLNFLKNADAQELEKLSTDFIKGAKDIFGARVTDNEIKLLLATLPNLSQSREGMLRVISNLEAANSAAELRKAAADEIIKENGGKRPRDLNAQVEERISPELDKLAENFKPEKYKSSLFGSEALGKLAQSTGLIY